MSPYHVTLPLGHGTPLGTFHFLDYLVLDDRGWDHLTWVIWSGFLFEVIRVRVVLVGETFVIFVLIDSTLVRVTRSIN